MIYGQKTLNADGQTETDTRMHTHTHTHTLDSIATYSVKMTEYKNEEKSTKLLSPRLLQLHKGNLQNVVSEQTGGELQ